jgi:chromosome segregation ATPase
VKTKFDSIVKIKKEAVDRIERNIQKINSSINMLKEKISSLQETLSSLSFPKEGIFSVFNQIKLQRDFLIQEINNLSSQIEVLQNRKKELLEELKKANLEYEKMKYLKDQEIKKILKEKLKKESLEMDELAILLRKNGE